MKINRKNVFLGEWVDIESVAPSVEISLVYAGAQNIFGRSLYPIEKGFLRRVVAEALELAGQESREKGLQLVVLDAYRPWSVTRLMWELTPEDRKSYVAHPSSGSRHNRGAAVDVMLKSLDHGNWLEMPSEFDDFSEKAHLNYETVSVAARQNREVLQELMTQQGFLPLSIEWWHFDFPDWESQPVEDLSFEQLERETNSGVSQR